MLTFSISNSINYKMFVKRLTRFNNIPGPRVGDFLLLNDGRFTRFTHFWKDIKGRPDHLQTGGNSESFYFCESGRLSYSGSLNDGIAVEEIEQIPNEFKWGRIWLFDKDRHEAGNGAETEILFRVFKIKDESKINLRNII